jgi:hypothetical protein
VPIQRASGFKDLNQVVMSLSRVVLVGEPVTICDRLRFIPAATSFFEVAIRDLKPTPFRPLEHEIIRINLCAIREPCCAGVTNMDEGQY